MPSIGSKASIYANIKNQRDKNEAFKCYKKAADLGNMRAMNNLGLIVESGFDDVPADPERACSLFK